MFFILLNIQLIRLVLQAFFSKVIQVEGELSGSSVEVKAARKVLQMEVMEPGATNNVKTNDLHLYKAVNRVLVYRILDICQWVKSEKPSRNSTILPAPVESQRDLLQELVCVYTFFIFLGQLPLF
jgi:hypothetical protein